MPGNKPAYVVGYITVRDPEKWAEYKGRVPATLAPWGAELVFRGTRVAVLSGEHECGYEDIVAIRFPDAGSASGWYNSPAYQALIPLRTQAADVVLVSHESATG